MKYAIFFQDTSTATDDASISMANLSTNSVGLSTSLLLAGDNAPRTFDHLDHDFLKSDMIRDAAKRRPDDEDYDPHTLYVPDAFLKRQTPGHRQWWQFKSQYFDTILLFKVGKFYELYHMDAVIAVTELGLVYMRVLDN
jgi:DNA mismatch repair protein MSH6